MGRNRVDSVLLGIEPEENCPGGLHPHARPVADAGYYKMQGKCAQIRRSGAAYDMGTATLRALCTAWVHGTVRRPTSLNAWTRNLYRQPLRKPVISASGIAVFSSCSSSPPSLQRIRRSPLTALQSDIWQAGGINSQATAHLGQQMTIKECR